MCYVVIEIKLTELFLNVIIKSRSISKNKNKENRCENFTKEEKHIY